MTDKLPGVAVRRLLHRKVLATNRHRAEIGQRLKLGQSELGALALLAERGSLTPGELGTHLVLTSGGVTALLQRLESTGHLHRTPHPRDGRSAIIRADSGILSEVAALNAPLVNVLDAEIAALTPEAQRVVARFLARITAAIEREADALAISEEDEVRAVGDEGLEPGLWT